MRKHVKWKRLGLVLSLLIFLYNVICWNLKWIASVSQEVNELRLYSAFNETKLFTVRSSTGLLQPCCPRYCHSLINSRKFGIGCFSVNSELYPILVTGLGGSGTHEVANMLNLAGLKVPHEGLGHHGSVVSCGVLCRIELKNKIFLIIIILSAPNYISFESVMVLCRE